MLKGGYQIIDFENKNHEVGIGMVHEGIYNKIDGTRKTCLLSGIVLDGSEAHDYFCSPNLIGSTFYFVTPMVVSEGTIAHVCCKVEDTNVVTFSLIG